MYLKSFQGPIYIKLKSKYLFCTNKISIFQVDIFFLSIINKKLTNFKLNNFFLFITIVQIINSLIIVLRDRNIILGSIGNYSYFLSLFLLVFFIKLDKYSKYSFYLFYIIRVVFLFNNYLSSYNIIIGPFISRPQIFSIDNRISNYKVQSIYYSFILLRSSRNLLLSQILSFLSKELLLQLVEY